MIFGLTEREWMRLPLAPRWQTVTSWEDVKDYPVVEPVQDVLPGFGLLSQLSTVNRAPVGFRESWFCLVCRCWLLRVEPDVARSPVSSSHLAVDNTRKRLARSGAQIQLFP